MIHNIGSDELKEKILTTYGTGIEFDVKCYNEEHGRAITVLGERTFDEDDGLRTCSMHVSSFVGISFGANHHYVRLYFHGCTFTNLDGTKHPHSGVWPNGMPDEAESTEIEVRRPVTQRDIDYAKKRKDGWIPRPGDTERGFWTEQEAHDAGIACFKEWFGPGWKLVHNDPDTGDLVEIART